MPVFRDPARFLARKLPLLFLLVILALLRAERGVAELQGRTARPSRLLHLSPAPAGEDWALSLLGHQVAVPSPAGLLETIKDALPE